MAETKHRGVVSCLSRGYWNSSGDSMTPNSYRFLGEVDPGSPAA